MSPDALKTFVEQLLATLGVVPEALEVSTGHRTVVRVTTSGTALVGQDGETLRALNTIAKRMVEHAHGEEAAGFLIDINGWHEGQLEKVRVQARMLAQRARLFKHDVDMPPASAYERLVIHELFSEDPEIQTESAGEGKFRHVVLKYKTAV